jgi:hypothetical protein
MRKFLAARINLARCLGVDVVGQGNAGNPDQVGRGSVRAGASGSPRLERQLPWINRQASRSARHLFEGWMPESLARCFTRKFLAARVNLVRCFGG